MFSYITSPEEKVKNVGTNSKENFTEKIYSHPLFVVIIFFIIISIIAFIYIKYFNSKTIEISNE